MRLVGVVLAVALLAATACEDDQGGRPAADTTFDADDGCSMSTAGPFAVSTSYVAREEMLSAPPDSPPPTYEPVDQDVLSDASLPAEVGGLPAQSMLLGEHFVTVYYGGSAVSTGFESDLTAKGGLVVTNQGIGMTGEQALRNMQNLVGPRVTPVRIGTSIGWFAQVDGDHFGAVSKPQQVNWVEGHRLITVKGVRDPAELVVTARAMACGQAS